MQTHNGFAIGIDPGKSGAVATIKDGHLIECIQMPLLLNDIDYESVNHVYTSNVDSHRSGLVYIEKQNIFASGQQVNISGQSVRLVNYGKHLGHFQANDIPHKELMPQTWQKIVRVCIKSKAASKEFGAKDKAAIAAMKLFCSSELALLKMKRADKLHDGKVDAALIALYGWLHNTGQDLETYCNELMKQREGINHNG